jgi:hypothetical protein
VGGRGREWEGGEGAATGRFGGGGPREMVKWCGVWREVLRGFFLAGFFWRECREGGKEMHGALLDLAGDGNGSAGGQNRAASVLGSHAPKFG